MVNVKQRLEVMIIAGEPSGDERGAELVVSLREKLRAQGAEFAPRIFGAGGPALQAAGVELKVNMMELAVVGLSEVIKNFRRFQAVFAQLLEVAAARQPDLIICIDFSGFNRRFATAIRKLTAGQRGPFANWRPKIVQFVSPQVWASRPGRAYQMAKDLDLLISIFPFEQAWYAQRVPQLAVEYVGHPLMDQHRTIGVDSAKALTPLVLLLPGSRRDEIRRHLPVLLEACALMDRAGQFRYRVIFPNPELRQLAQPWLDQHPKVQAQLGGLTESLQEASVALASTGTVTLECALFELPTVALYKTSWPTYLIGRQIVQVKYLAMPNILADEPIFPEFIQAEATSANLAQSALELLNNPERRNVLKAKLKQLKGQLGSPGACGRAAEAILSMLSESK